MVFTAIASDCCVLFFFPPPEIPGHFVPVKIAYPTTAYLNFICPVTQKFRNFLNCVFQFQYVHMKEDGYENIRTVHLVSYLIPEVINRLLPTKNKAVNFLCQRELFSWNSPEIHLFHALNYA